MLLALTAASGPVLPVSPAALLYSQQLAPWRDPSPHRVQFVSVDENVRLEVLDWGGSGRPIVLLAGGGDTAHVFDDFAPKLTADYHVFGITRRGFGASSVPASGYGADRLGDDVLAVLDSLKLNRPVLVGHSLGGEELSSVATRHPERVRGLIYLRPDTSMPSTTARGRLLRSWARSRGPNLHLRVNPTWPASGRCKRTISAVTDSQFPRRSTAKGWDSTPDGRVGKRRDFPEAIMKGMKKYTDITVPALAIFSIPHNQGPWVNNSTDPKVREAAKAYTAAEVILTERQAKAFENGVPGARVVRLPAHHYVYLSNQADVLREMHSFLAGEYSVKTRSISVNQGELSVKSRVFLQNPRRFAANVRLFSSHLVNVSFVFIHIPASVDLN